MRALVVDASVLVEYLLGTEAGRSLAPILTAEDSDLHVPALTDLEVPSALRRIERSGEIDGERAAEAIRDFLDLPLTRFEHQRLVPRIFEMRHSVSSYDAAYVALAEALSAALVTADRRLRAAAESASDVEIL